MGVAGEDGLGDLERYRSYLRLLAGADVDARLQGSSICPESSSKRCGKRTRIADASAAMELAALPRRATTCGC
jgi:hypothetical protein